MIQAFESKAIYAISRKEGYNRNTFEKAWRLVDILNIFNSDPAFKGHFALKGGTAINLFLFDDARLSCDLDFDYIPSSINEDIKDNRQLFGQKIEAALIHDGYRKSNGERKSFSTDSSSFQFTNAGGGKDAIKIDINYSNRAHLLEVDFLSTKVSWRKGERALCLDPLEIFASKISALLSRAAVRDLYDVCQLSKNNLFSKSDLSLLNKMVAFYLILDSQSVSDAYGLTSFEGLDQYAAKRFIVPMIKRGLYFDVEEGKEETKTFLKSFLSISEECSLFEKNFLNGVYDPSLLFPIENGIADQVRNHPMAIWKSALNKKAKQGK